ncbi:MAG TPA: zinc ribbon domain-containing protein [Terracidiphilus sp.]|nr:zinc ribbon domain-containing protein [Terracidiphilus sp.]
MPLYEYRCTSCGHRFDKIQKFNDQPETACPKCGGELERPLSAPAFQFKGGGWYINDYASKPASGSKTDKPAGDSAAASGDSKSAESKPAESKSASSESSSKPAPTPSPSSTNS